MAWSKSAYPPLRYGRNVLGRQAAVLKEDDMDNEQHDMSRELMLDGNAVAGLLRAIFGAEMSASTTECNHCGKVGQIGSLLAFIQGPGVVLRCPHCEGVMLR